MLIRLLAFGFLVLPFLGVLGYSRFLPLGLFLGVHAFLLIGLLVWWRCRFLVCTRYMDRLALPSSELHLYVTPLTAHRLFTASLIIAIKFIAEEPPSQFDDRHVNTHSNDPPYSTICLALCNMYPLTKHAS